jgi:hypothetical protein
VRLAPDDGFASGKVIEKLTAGKEVFQIEKQKIKKVQRQTYFIYHSRG